MKVQYLADISGDIDDVIAIEFLHKLNLLDSVVLDGKSSDRDRINYLYQCGISLVDDISSKVLFCGGAFTKVADCLRAGHKFDLLVVNGFFAGLSFNQSEALAKFKGLRTCRSYNPGLDIESADYLVSCGAPFVAVSKDVCHHEDNVTNKWHNNHSCKPTKKLHDLLMVKEGLRILYDQPTMFNYSPVSIFREGDKWGSAYNSSSPIKIVSSFNPDFNV